MRSCRQRSHCQPNFRRDVVPDPDTSCGPYRPAAPGSRSAAAARACSQHVRRDNHDTIAMIAIDAAGNIAAGASSNGASHKACSFSWLCCWLHHGWPPTDGLHQTGSIDGGDWRHTSATFQVPGRVGDAAVPGGGAYADSEVGACGSTGDGDIHLRFLPCYHVSCVILCEACGVLGLFCMAHPCFRSPIRAEHCVVCSAVHGMQSTRIPGVQVVEGMRHGLSPQAAAEAAVRRMVRKYPAYVGALLAVDRTGRHAAACHGWTFTYAVRSAGMTAAQVYTVDSLEGTPDVEAVPSGLDLTA
jgi:N4-(beta-N-acetylglucosaminyl)-L-asparaginase